MGGCVGSLVCTGVWLVESMSWVCMLMGGHIFVYAGSVHSCWGGEKCYLVHWASNIKF